MKKSIVAMLTVFSVSHAFAECDGVPYNAPEELHPQCERQVGAADSAANAKGAKAEQSDKPGGRNTSNKPLDHEIEKTVHSISNVDKK
jgi:hypothetical protein